MSFQAQQQQCCSPKINPFVQKYIYSRTSKAWYHFCHHFQMITPKPSFFYPYLFLYVNECHVPRYHVMRVCPNAMSNSSIKSVAEYAQAEKRRCHIATIEVLIGEQRRQHRQQRRSQSQPWRRHRCRQLRRMGLPWRLRK